VDEVAFGRHRPLSLIGEGAMGKVWRVHDTAANNRIVAIKVLPSQLAADLGAERHTHPPRILQGVRGNLQKRVGSPIITNLPG
jgi:serine/threonine protein kinase